MSAYGFDPSIILSAPKDPQPSLTELLQAASQLKTAGLQRQQLQASLADLTRQQAQQEQLQGIYKSNADAPDALPTALLRGGFGPQAATWQDQNSQMLGADVQRKKLLEDVKKAHREHISSLFSDVTDQAGWDAARKELGDHPDPMISIYGGVIPQQFDPAAAKKLSALGLSAKERADLEDKGALRTETERHDRAIESRLARQGAGGVSPDDLSAQALDDFAGQLHTTGQMPAGLGMGKAAAAMRVKIANRAAEMFGGTDLGATKAGYSANAESLKKQQKTADAMNAFEGTALKNLDTFLEQAKQVVGIGSPLFNAPARKFAESVAGDPRMAAFSAARQTAVQEIGKVLSGSQGSAAISDSARHEVEGLLKPDASLKQLMAAADILKRDMANRRAAVDAQLSETRGRMSSKGSGASKATGKLSQSEADELEQLRKELGQ